MLKIVIKGEKLKLIKKTSNEIKSKAPFNSDALIFKTEHFPTPDHIGEIFFGKKEEKISWLEKENRL